MSNSPADAVLAGTKTFAVALLAPLTTRVGVRPRIAADATQAAALCGPGALVVIEYAGAEALAGIERLVKDGGRRVVAGVSAAHAGDEPALRALGVEIARWDGRPDGVLEAVSRRIGAPQNGAAPVAPTAPSKPFSAAAPAAKPAPAAAAAPAARPAAPAPAAPGAKPAAPAPVAKPAAAPPAAARPPAAPVARPSPAPAPVAKPVAPARPAPAPAPAAAKPAPAPAAPVAARPAAPPVAAAPAAPAKPAAVAPVAPEPPAPAPAKPAVAPAPTFFDDIGEDGVDVDPIDLDVSDAFELLAPADAVPAQPPSEPAGDWPATLPDEPAAAEALVLAIAGRAQGPYAAVAVQVVDALSGLEKAVLSGEAQPFDGTALRRAATMRLRVAQALATVPPAGSRVDQAAVNVMLGEIDGLLSAVATLATGVPPESQAAVEAVRHDLVAEAIDFSEAVQKLQPSEAAAPAAAPAPTAAARRAAQTRVISVGSGDAEVAEERRGRRMWIVLAVVLIAAGGFHGYRYWSRQQGLASLPSVPGAPANMILVSGTPNGIHVLAPIGGKRPDRGEVQRFKDMEQARGFDVRELSGGTLEVRPAVKGAQR